MANAMGFSVRIFIPSGEPEGLRIVEKSNWTGQGLIFPRSLFAEVRHRKELERTGVYILWSPSGPGQLPQAYIGESDVLRPRLDSHARDKDFWTHGVAFASKDQNLNKAHVQYIEARLVKLAEEAKRCKLENGNTPQTPSLSESDTADAELYLADMLLCLPVLGVSFFEKPQTREGQDPHPITKGDLTAKGKGIEAQGYEDLEGRGFVVRTDSQVTKEEANSIPTHVSDLRKVLQEQGVLEDAGKAYRFTEDYIFSSPSTAAGVVLGKSSNGRTEWRDSEGRTLKEIQEIQQAEDPDNSEAE